MLPRNHGERIFSCSYRYGFLKIETPGIRKLRHKVKGSDRVTIRLRETTTPHDDNHLPAPSSVISALTIHLETGGLNSLPSWVESQAVDYALARAPFRADEIRLLDSNGSVERVIPFDETDRARERA